MKSHFKSFLVLVVVIMLNSTASYSRDIILIENLADNQSGQTLLKIIQQKFNIPRKLITYRNVGHKCMEKSDAIMQLCLKADGEMEIVKINKFVIEETFRVFTEAGQ